MLKSCFKSGAAAGRATSGSVGNAGEASCSSITCIVRDERCSSLEDILYAMSVARRNTFDLFDEEADLLTTSEAKTAQKKKRRKRKPSLEYSENQISQVAAGRGHTEDGDEHEVGPDMGQHCQSCDLKSDLFGVQSSWHKVNTAQCRI